MFIQNHHSPEFLREMSKSRKYIYSRDRIRAVYLAMKNHSLNQIIKLLDRSRGFVKKWIKTYNEQGLSELLEKKNSLKNKTVRSSERRVHF